MIFLQRRQHICGCLGSLGGVNDNQPIIADNHKLVRCRKAECHIDIVSKHISRRKYSGCALIPDAYQPLPVCLFCDYLFDQPRFVDGLCAVPFSPTCLPASQPTGCKTRLAKSIDSDLLQLQSYHSSGSDIRRDHGHKLNNLDIGKMLAQFFDDFRRCCIWVAPAASASCAPRARHL